jgi:hypothetical protein
VPPAAEQQIWPDLGIDYPGRDAATPRKAILTQLYPLRGSDINWHQVCNTPFMKQIIFSFWS